MCGRCCCWCCKVSLIALHTMWLSMEVYHAVFIRLHCVLWGERVTVSARLDALTPRSYRARNALVGVRSTAEPKKSPSMSAAHSVTDLCVRVRQTDRQTDRRFSRRRASRHWARGCLDRCRRRRRRETLTQHIPRRRRCRRARLRRTTGCWWLDVVSAGFLVAYRPYTSTPSVCADPDGRIGS